MSIDDTPLDQELTFTGVDVLNLDSEKSDTARLSHAIRAIRCKPNTGVAGDVKLVTLAGNTVTTEITAGEFLELGALKIFSTGTTATGLEGIV